LNAGRELGSETGPTHSDASTGSSVGGQSYSSAAGGSAPNYVNNSAASEGGFDSSAPNASFNSDIGGKNDPGRAALQNLQRADAQAGGDAGSGPRQSGVSNDGQFDILKDAEA